MGVAIEPRRTRLNRRSDFVRRPRRRNSFFGSVRVLPAAGARFQNRADGDACRCPTAQRRGLWAVPTPWEDWDACRCPTAQRRGLRSVSTPWENLIHLFQFCRLEAGAPKVLSLTAYYLCLFLYYVEFPIAQKRKRTRPSWQVRERRRN